MGDWGKVFVATRYQPYLPAQTCESLIGLAVSGLRPGDVRDEDLFAFPWPKLEANKLELLKAALMRRYAPATAGKVFAAVKGVLRACAQAGEIGADFNKNLAAGLDKAFTGPGAPKPTLKLDKIELPKIDAASLGKPPPKKIGEEEVKGGRAELADVARKIQESQIKNATDARQLAAAEETARQTAETNEHLRKLAAQNPSGWTRAGPGLSVFSGPA